MKDVKNVFIILHAPGGSVRTILEHSDPPLQAVPQGNTSATVPALPVLKGRIPKAEPLPAVRHVQRCTPAREVIPVPAARQTEPAPALTADPARLRLPPAVPAAVRQGI